MPLPSIKELQRELDQLAGHATADVRRSRKGMSRRLAAVSEIEVLRLATELLKSSAPHSRFVGYELIAFHPRALSKITPRIARQLGKGMPSWGDTDMFGCLIAGRAWRCGALPDAETLSWTRSPDRWWRRAALVATVPLNVRAQGGTGDAQRTLRICRALRADRDDMVVKALSWSLRALVRHDPAAVRDFVSRYETVLPCRVLREVKSKLTTGRKGIRRATR